MSFLAVSLFILAASLPTLNAQCTTQQCPTSPPYLAVNLTSDDDYLYVSTSACPPFDNPNWRNPGIACDQGAQYSIAKRPVYSRVPIPTGERIGQYQGIHYLREDPQPILGAIGVLVNGVVVFGVGAPCGGNSVCPNTDSLALSTYVDAVESEGVTFDQCGGHPAPGNQNYHIHSGNTFNSSAGRRACALPEDTPGEHSVLLGWMFDGFPLYGQYSQGGKLPTQLDSCHGHTHMINGTMQYHYHLPMDFPWMIGCFKGCPIVRNNRRQLNFNGNATYGCPQGLTTDPNPVYEDEVIATPSPSATPTANSPDGSANVVAMVTLMGILLVVSFFLSAV